MPPVIPAAKLSPTGPKIIVIPPVMYSQPFDPQPSTIAGPPEFLTANLSPAFPDAKSFPFVAPYKTVLPTITFSLEDRLLNPEGLTTIKPPDSPLAT